VVDDVLQIARPLHRARKTRHLRRDQLVALRKVGEKRGIAGMPFKPVEKQQRPARAGAPDAHLEATVDRNALKHDLLLRPGRSRGGRAAHGSAARTELSSLLRRPYAATRWADGSVGSVRLEECGMRFHWFAEATYPDLPAEFKSSGASIWVDTPRRFADP